MADEVANTLEDVGRTVVRAETKLFGCKRFYTLAGFNLLRSLTKVENLIILCALFDNNNNSIGEHIKLFMKKDYF